MKAIVYTSNTGHTAQYAKMLAEKTGLSLFTLEDAIKQLDKGSEIIYLGWLFANSLKGYKKASKHFKISVVCGVGLCDTGCLLKEVRKSISLPEDIPLFTVQGGINRAKLKGINKFMINMLIKMMSSKKAPSQDDKRMLQLLTSDASYVKSENLADLLSWYSDNK